MPDMAPLMVAKQNATYDFMGAPVILVAGKTIVRQGHPVMKGHEDLFEPVLVHYETYPAEDPVAPVNPARADMSGARTRGPGRPRKDSL